jgi:ankyrin repeat protein
LKDYRCGEVFCIIDGVDQILPAEKDIMFDLARLCVEPEKSGPALWSNTFKLIFTVRPTRAIRAAMSKVSDNRQIPSLWLKGEDLAATGMIKHDIELYVGEEVRALSGKFSAEKEALLIRQLVERADANFLWAHLILTTMKASPSLTGAVLDGIINDPPRQMDSLYHSLLRSTVTSEKGRIILQMIVGSATPLTLSELNTAFTIATKQDNKYTRRIEEEPDIERTIQMLCGSLVKVVYERVYLVHWTAKHFLLSVGLTDLQNPSWRPLNIHECNEVLALSCVRYLTFHVPLFRGLSEPSAPPQYPLLNHASQYWSLYVRKSDQSQHKTFISDALSLLKPKAVRLDIWFSRYWRAERPWQPRPRTWTTLMMASFLGLEAVVNYLLEGTLQRPSEKQTERQGRDGRTAMDLAAESGHAGVVSRLLRSGILDLEFSGKFGHTAIHDAAAHGHTAVVETLSEAGVDVHAKTAHSETALHLAAHYGHTLTVESLLAVPSGVGSLGVSHGPGWTAIHSAADAGDIETLVVLIEKVGSASKIVDRINDDGYTALHLAAHGRLEPYRAPIRPNISIPLRNVSSTEYLGLSTPPLESITTLRPRKTKLKTPHYSDVILELVEHGADVNAKTPEGWTPLHFAAKYGREDLVNIFLMAGADATMRATSGLTAYDYANLKGHTAIAERLKAEKNNI